MKSEQGNCENHRRANQPNPETTQSQTLGVLSTWACLIFAIGLLIGCDQNRSNHSAGRESNTPAADVIWSFMVNDSTPDARIRRWERSTLRGLMIVDQDRSEFFDQFSPLVRQVGESINVEIGVCRAVMSPAALHPPSGPSCEREGYDFYYIITDGSWTEAQWHDIRIVLQGQPVELLSKLREQMASESGGKNCRYGIRTNELVAGRIELAVAVIDTEFKSAIGSCATYQFLHVLGLYPFDGAQPVKPEEEARNPANFLLKKTPNGGEYLLGLLYSRDVRAGMTKADFLETLSKQAQ